MTETGKPLVTVVILTYNQERFVGQAIESAVGQMCDFPFEVLVVDDCSTDGTKDLYPKFEGKYKILYHEKNQGKGAALRTGFEAATGDIVVIQDADLEYDPVDYEPLIQLILDGKADVCYGSRLSGGKPSRSFMFHHLLGNKFLSLLTNILYGSTLTDMETCYKAFRREFIKDIKIKSDRFDFEPEITAKVLKKRKGCVKIYHFGTAPYGVLELIKMQGVEGEGNRSLLP